MPIVLVGPRDAGPPVGRAQALTNGSAVDVHHQVLHAPQHDPFAPRRCLVRRGHPGEGADKAGKRYLGFKTGEGRPEAVVGPGAERQMFVRALSGKVDLVSHPGTIVPAERAAIEAYLHAFDTLRYDADRGPVRFVTLQDLAKAYAR